MMLVADDEASVVSEPREKTLDFPPAFVAAKRPAILCLRSVATVGGNHLDSQGIEVGVESVAVVCLVSNQSRGQSDREGLDRLPYEPDFGRRSACCANGDRKTIPICDGHDFGAFASLGLPDLEPPFFAGLNVPSMKASVRLSLPRRCSS